MNNKERKDMYKHIQKCNIYLPGLCYNFLGLCNICLWGGGPLRMVWYGFIVWGGGTQPNVTCRWGVHVTYCLGGGRGGYDSYIDVGVRKSKCILHFWGPLGVWVPYGGGDRSPVRSPARPYARPCVRSRTPSLARSYARTTPPRTIRLEMPWNHH